jgi:AAHS family 4-hydroxybenzoate transporter-like MFS transporter
MTAINISAAIDDSRLGGFQKRLIAFCAMLAFVEGFDAQVAGYLVPALTDAWNFSPTTIGMFVSTGLFGILLGSLVLAPLADRVGRKPIILIALVTVGVGSLGMAAATTSPALFAFRFLAGFGIGAAMPNAIALTSEYVPTRSRGFGVVLMFNGFNLGALVAGLATAEMVHAFGWRGVFALGGVLPLLLVPVFAFLVPESIRFLALRGGADESLGRLLRKIDPAIDPRAGDHFVLEDARHKAMSVRALFTDGRAKRTILLWVIFFMSLLDLFVLTTWLPAQVARLGFPVRTAILVGALLQAGAIAGVVLGWAADRFGPAKTLSAAYGVAVVAIVGLALAGRDLPLILITVFCTGFGVIGGQVAANAVAATSYITEIRSTGVGWALAVGRLGSIVGPSVAGVLIAAQAAPRDVFLLAAVPAAIAGLAALLLGAQMHVVRR